MDEVLLIDKPAGMTSFGVVARARRKLSEEAAARLGNLPSADGATAARRKKPKIKVGHTGTLDPFATGLMILLIGKGTKRSDEFLKLDKVYEATICLGQTSSTGDPEGEITEVAGDGEPPSEADVTRMLEKFVGEIEQVPPIYSAIKIDGERAYKRARKGEAVEMPTRRVTIYALELVNYAYPVLKVRAHVSSGTYIRTLAEDIGRALGTGAYCQELRRTRVADFTVEEARTMADLGILS